MPPHGLSTFELGSERVGTMRGGHPRTPASSRSRSSSAGPRAAVEPRGDAATGGALDLDEHDLQELLSGLALAPSPAPTPPPRSSSTTPTPTPLRLPSPVGPLRSATFEEKLALAKARSSKLSKPTARRSPAPRGWVWTACRALGVLVWALGVLVGVGVLLADDAVVWDLAPRAPWWEALHEAAAVPGVE